MTTIETLAVKLIGDVSDFNNKMSGAVGAIQSVGDKMQATGDRMQAIGQKWSMFISAPLIAMGKAALDSAADFEVSMNIIEQVTDATTEQMDAMSKQALKLGKDTVFSAGEAAKAQLELAKAGMDVNQTMDAMPGVLDLAAAGGVELATAAKLTAGVLNAFSLEASESTRVANLLAAAANASAADIGDLSLGFAQGGFAFAAANQKVDDLAASLAILTNVGLKGTDAGTALKNMFTQLYGPTAKAKDTMEAYGIEIYDATGTMKPLVEIIGIFNEKLGGLSQEQRLAALDTILLSDGMKAMIPLMTAGTEGFLEMKDAVNEQGAAADVANARMKGLSGSIEYFKGTLDTLMIQSATPWLDQLGTIIRMTADWIAKFGELDPAVQKNIVIMAALVAAVGPVLIYGGLLVSSIGSIVSAFGVLSAAIFANPIVALAALSAALIVFAVGWDENWFGVQEKTATVVDYISLRLTDLDAWIRENVPELGPWLDAFESFSAGAKKGWDDAFPSMKKSFEEFGATIEDEIPKLVTSFGRLWTAVFGGEEGDDPETAGRKLVSRFMNFIGLVTSAIGTIISQIRIMIDGLGYAISAVKSFLSGDFDAAGEAAKNFTASMKEFGEVTGGQYQKFLDYLKEWEEKNTTAGGGSGGFGYAEGGYVGSSGRYMVGERGAEMVDLPAGAYVHNDRDTARMGQAITVTQYITVGSGADRTMVTAAAKNGALAALRQVGVS